jgi:hypothetical protein
MTKTISIQAKGLRVLRPIRGDVFRDGQAKRFNPFRDFNIDLSVKDDDSEDNFQLL